MGNVEGGTDYCYSASDDPNYGGDPNGKSLSNKGGNEDRDNFPLGLCEGDCDGTRASVIARQETLLAAHSHNPLLVLFTFPSTRR